MTEQQSGLARTTPRGRPWLSPKRALNHRWPPEDRSHRSFVRAALRDVAASASLELAAADDPAPDQDLPSPERRLPSPLRSLVQSPVRVRDPLSPPWKEAPPENLARVVAKNDVTASLWLRSQPLMEVAEPAGAVRSTYSLGVHKTSDLESDVVTQLRPYERMRVISTRTLPDGTERACIMLESTGKLLGWLTAATPDGTSLIHIYARPLYEVTSATKVREKMELTSKFVTQLPAGTKVHVVESRKMRDGSLRVCVTRLGHQIQYVPLGWVTARRVNEGVETTRTLRQVNASPIVAAIPIRAHASPAFVGQHQKPKPARPFTTGLDAEKRRPRRSTTDSATAAGDDDPQVSRTPRGTLSEEFGAVTGCSASERSSASSGPLGSASAASRTAAGTGTFRRSGSAPEGGQGSFRQKRSSRASRDGPDGDGSVASATERWQHAGDSVKAQQKVSKALRAKEDAKAREREEKLLTSASIEAVAIELLQQAANEEAQAHVKTPLSVQLGSVLQSRKIVISDLMREWDPNADGEISRMEFRQNLRKLLDEPVASEIDALFISLDIDKSGALDVNEIKIALKRLQNEASNAMESANAAIARADALKEKAAHAKAVAELTAELENASVMLDRMNSKTVGTQIGAITTKKGMKAVDIVKQWDASDDGEIDKNEFRNNVLRLGVVATRAEVDSFFDSLDIDGGGALDTEEIRRMLKKVQDEADETKQAMKRLGNSSVELTKKVKAAQTEWKKARKAEEDRERERIEREEHESQMKARAAKEAKAAKMAAVEEKKQAEALQKAEFDSRIAVKRLAASQKKQKKPPSAMEARAEIVLATAAMIMAAGAPAGAPPATWRTTAPAPAPAAR